jgi:hypothetical protein
VEAYKGATLFLLFCRLMQHKLQKATCRRASYDAVCVVLVHSEMQVSDLNKVTLTWSGTSKQLHNHDTPEARCHCPGNHQIDL